MFEIGKDLSFMRFEAAKAWAELADFTLNVDLVAFLE